MCGMKWHQSQLTGLFAVILTTQTSSVFVKTNHCQIGTGAFCHPLWYCSQINLRYWWKHLLSWRFLNKACDTTTCALVHDCGCQNICSMSVCCNWHSHLLNQYVLDFILCSSLKKKKQDLWVRFSAGDEVILFKQKLIVKIIYIYSCRNYRC